MSWKIRKQTEVFKVGFFRLRYDECEMASGKIMPKYFVMEFSDWVHIVPITSDGKVLLIEQYRHANQSTCLELPGGTTHPGANEDPQLAAERELLEETGYQSSDWKKLATHAPNPALQNNSVHTYLALNCKKVAEQSLDPYEEITVKEFSKKEVLDLLASGQITHSLVVASLYYALEYLKD